MLGTVLWGSTMLSHLILSTTQQVDITPLHTSQMGSGWGGSEPEQALVTCPGYQ